MGFASRLIAGGIEMVVKDLIMIFADAINKKKMVMVKFNAKGNGQILLRKCAPLDYALSKRAKIQRFKFHFWDFDSSKQNHVLSLDSEQIIEVYILEESFKPDEIISWNTKETPWFIARDWGIYS